MRKMPEKLPMTVAARIDDTPVFLFIYLFLCMRKTESLVVIPRVNSIGQR